MTRELAAGAVRVPAPYAGDLANARRGRHVNEPWWIDAIKAVVIINLLLGLFAYSTLLERKLIGRMQLRYGPNRTGPFGLLQPIADLVKLIRKESFAPATAVDFLYFSAPAMSAAPRSPPSP